MQAYFEEHFQTNFDTAFQYKEEEKYDAKKNRSFWDMDSVE